MSSSSFCFLQERVFCKVNGTWFPIEDQATVKCIASQEGQLGSTPCSWENPFIPSYHQACSEVQRSLGGGQKIKWSHGPCSSGGQWALILCSLATSLPTWQNMQENDLFCYHHNIFNSTTCKTLQTLYFMPGFLCLFALHFVFWWARELVSQPMSFQKTAKNYYYFPANGCSSGRYRELAEMAWCPFGCGTRWQLFYKGHFFSAVKILPPLTPAEI